MKTCYLIYHPQRNVTDIGNIRVFHDKFGGNEDPYLWNNNFLHTYCHITQLPNNEGQINFWISADKYSDFNSLFCDCVFVIKSKHFWKEKNYISPSDQIVDNNLAFEHHYKWAEEGHHRFLKRRRYTLKADEDLSFQPQDSNHNLIDILPFLIKNGITKEELLNSIRTKKGSKPYKLGEGIGEMLYNFLLSASTIKLYGKNLADKHPNNQAKSSKCYMK